jgi:hypothetical protein
MASSISSQVAFQVYRGVYITFEELFAQAAEFATRIGRDRLISISHSEDENDGVVTVWYWEDRVASPPPSQPSPPSSRRRPKPPAHGPPAPAAALRAVQRPTPAAPASQPEAKSPPPQSRWKEDEKK